MIEYVNSEWGQFIDIEQIIDEKILTNYEQIVIKELNYSKQNIFIKYVNKIISFIATLRYF